ncbi:uncharacterized protein LOC121862575 [Homarus americanus]|uniref:uncharacterized protein LOC121862575 n=1 Tax=Homarus americanus TaxID=6706 RepID=UPI001C48C815|nr:uncharacterized protein LOC121862575 [Homarus americanus]XP_042216831.1 uncharacterized protein LOC121862575 [Homarus americanus]
MIYRRRIVRRFLPFVCCFLLLRIFVIREDGGVPREELRRRPVPGDDQEGGGGRGALRKDVTHHTYSRSQASEGQLSDAPALSPSLEDHQPSQPPLRYRNSVSEGSALAGEGLGDTEGNKHEVQGLERTTTTSLNSWPLWMRVTDDLYTYSAFWDSRKDLVDGPVVRVLGMLRYRKELVKEGPGYRWTGEVKDGLLNCSCFLWYRERKQPQEGQLKAFIYEEGLKTFVGTFLLCYPPAPKYGGSSGETSLNGSLSVEPVSEASIPYGVSFPPHNTLQGHPKLIYLNNYEKISSVSSTKSNTSAVCVRQLFGPYIDLRGITQFIAYYTTVLRVSHFYFYDQAINIKVKELLRLFNSKDVTIHILPWNVPVNNNEDLWDLGSLTALTDCVYRSSGRHTHLAMVDLDEFIVPRTPAADLGELYHNILTPKQGEVGDAALVPNVFYCSDFKENAEEHEELFQIFQFKQREARLWPSKSRSKMIVIPEAVISVGHHMIHHFLKKTSKNQASHRSVSILHHYRTCGNLRLGRHATGSLVLDQETMKDAAMIKYKKAILTSRTVAIYRKFIHQG